MATWQSSFASTSAGESHWNDRHPYVPVVLKKLLQVGRARRRSQQSQVARVAGVSCRADDGGEENKGPRGTGEHTNQRQVRDETRA